jgi:signal transduction histidine kinase/CheY-like chemotaxis protein
MRGREAGTVMKLDGDNSVSELEAVVGQPTALELMENAVRAEERLRKLLEAELADTQLLSDVSGELLHEQSLDALYGKILDAAVAIMRSDFGSMQMLYPERGRGGELRLLAFRGFSAEAEKFWLWVRADSESTCGVALHTGKRVVVADVATCAFMAGTEDQATYVQTGIRAVQSTPLVSRSGKLLGMISTHWRAPNDPSERDLRLLDILARQAADLLERRRAEEALKEADRRKDEFLATLSHELRNPLAPIRNAVELLRDGAGERAIVEQVRGILERQVGHMTRLVDELLELSRVTSGTIALQQQVLDLHDAVANAVETSRPGIESADHKLRLSIPEEPLAVFADPLRLNQILSNLLNNAAKFMSAGGSIFVTVRGDDSHVAISVRDTGIGIAPEMLPHVFDMFAQARTRNPSLHGGLGIGLSLARKLVEMHGGSIEARSAGLGKGSEFVVRIPLVATVGRAAAPSTERRSASRIAIARHVLVVDDNIDAAQSLAMLLRKMGHEVRIAHDGHGAIEAANASPPEVVLLDISLPDVDGYSVAESLRRNRRLDGTRIVALTGFGSQDDRMRSREAGLDGHLVKPVNPDVLRSLLGP